MKVYILSDDDIEKLTTAMELAKFKANFPLHRIMNKPTDMTAAQEQEWSRRWDTLVDESHSYFHYHVHKWLQDTVRREQGGPQHG